MAAKKKQARARSPKYETLYDLLLLKLGALLDIEEQIAKALPKLMKAARSESLREAFASHLEETREQAERLQEAFGILDVAAKKIRVEAIRGLSDDCEWIVKSAKSPTARDALLIAGAQYIEHYEMAGYESAISWAEILEQYDVAELLRDTLKEEQGASKKLAGIARDEVNETIETGMEGSEEA